MIDLEFVQQLIRSVDESTIDNVEIERGGTRIRVSKTPDHAAPASTPAPAPAPAPAPTAGNASNSPAPVAEGPESGEDQGGPDLLEVTSPMVGTFYRAPTPGADPFTDVGERITKGATLCIIEAMKLMNELEAEVEGTVREVLVENGEPVEYGQVLFRVEPA
jgi:acetyl-CoA carboxylase biotin carboxyl carrier protein